MRSETGRFIGIDLGTTFSAMAYLDRHGVPVTIPNAEGELTTASVVLFETDGAVVVGREARRACLVCPDRVAACVKRDMGEKLYSHPVAGKRLSPPSIAALILKKLKQDAEKRIGPVVGAVITVPAYFDEGRRQATVNAGALAGMEVLDIINEPTSAALAYAFRGFVQRGGSPDDITAMAVSATAPTTALVYDLGGGTFDVTVITISGDQVRVLATDGDVRLGGKDWDERIVNHAAELFIEKYASDPRAEPQSHQDLLLASEEAKKDLSRRELTRFAVNHAGQRLTVEVSRSQFEEMTSDLLYRTESRVDRVVRQAKLTWDDIDEVLLVGGSTRMPQTPAMLRKITRQEPNGTLSVDEVVAHGAAIHAAILQVGGGKAEEPAQALIVEDEGEEEGLALPVIEEEEELETLATIEADEAEGISVYEEEAVPIILEEEGEEAPPAGAAEDAAAAGETEPADEGIMVFDEDIRNILQEVKTVNVNAHSLGVVARSSRSGREFASVLIPRNTPLPATQSKTYGTVRDDQKLVKVRVLEGESDDPEACITIGECVIAPLPRGLPRGSPISVAFTYDNSGRLHVRAKEETSDLTAKTTILRPGGMTKTELARARETISRMRIT